jgi:hypothetical protein
MASTDHAREALEEVRKQRERAFQALYATVGDTARALHRSQAAGVPLVEAAELVGMSVEEAEAMLQTFSPDG